MNATDTSMPTSNVSLTPRAAARINKVLATEASGAMLRVSVNGGGCSGFQYIFEVDTLRNNDDILIERDGAVVLIDETSLPFISGSVIDFIDDLMGQSFKIENPHATASCGCGTSFAI
jgi:iron-sulfur cluster assembly accessory protein